MDKPDTMVKIQTLGRFNISVDGKTAAIDWPDETLQVFFCSLLSPLDLYFTRDRICRSMWDIPATQTSRRRLEKMIIQPLGSFLVRELGFNPLLAGPEGIRIDQQRIHLDAVDFYRTVLEGLRLFSLSHYPAALETLVRANELYTGSYLPGIPGKIISSTRNELETLYRTAVLGAIPLTQSHDGQDHNGKGKTIAALKAA